MRAPRYDAAFILEAAPRVAKLTVRNLPDGVHHALRERAARRGHSMEAEVREILESAMNPQGRMKLASMLADMGRRACLREAEPVYLVGTMVRRLPGHCRAALIVEPAKNVDLCRSRGGLAAISK
jgi:antitoxin FitA